jgi:hypothetical protein
VRYFLCLVSIAALLIFCSATQGQDASLSPAEAGATKEQSPENQEPKVNASQKKQWRSLLPESGLDGWEVTDFGGQGEVVRQQDQLIFEMGDPLTGINYKKKDFPKTNFELELEAQRMEGNDFLCGLTFPVGDDFCSLIAGGWGGGVVGLSSVDGYDASENATSSYHTFENGQWYKFRVAVDEDTIKVWIDDNLFVEQERANHQFSTRIEVYVSQPLGFCAFQSKVALRNFRWRPLGSETSPK